MRITLLLAALAGCGGEMQPTVDAAVSLCPGESLYTPRADVATCSVRDIRAESSTLPSYLWGTFPSDVEPSPLGPRFVVIHQVFADPFNDDVLGTFYTLAGGCGEGGALHNGCDFDICVDVF